MIDDRHNPLARKIAELEHALGEARRRVERLEALAYEDPLTGTLNRRGFERECRRAQAFRNRYGTPVAVLMFDLDDFKHINDRFGHAAGDLVLVTAARVLRDHVRASDTVARLGGDEFAVLLWHIDQHQADLKGRTLARTFAETPITIGDNTIHARLSHGVSLIGDGDMADALNRADSALYRDKATGRATYAMMSGVS